LAASQSDAMKKHFESVEDYDTCADHVVPYNEEILETAYRKCVDEFFPQKPSPFTILDLGIGTAYGARVLLLDDKDAEITGVDFSHKMLEKAGKNLLLFNVSNRAKLVNADFTAWPFQKNAFDACISTITIHNVGDEEKRKLFKKIHSSLKTGGVFINADFVKSETEEEQKQWNNYYEQYLREHLQGQELETWLRHAFTEDKPAKLSDQKKWLAEAGFTETKIIWQKQNLAIYAAKK